MIAEASSVLDMLGQMASSLTTTVDPTLTTVTMPGVLEVGAALCGALTGALVACERRLDIVGVATLALVTGLGGGLLRDMILPTTSVYMIDHPAIMVGCLIVALVTFFFRGAWERMSKFIFLFDILSVALFTFAGADKALLMGYGAVSCALMGVITAVGGGMLRDICLGEVPLIFRAGTYYAIASIAGASVYLGLVELHVVKGAAALACVVVTIALRLLSVRYSILTKAPVDLTPRVAHAWRKLREEGGRKSSPKGCEDVGEGANKGADADDASSSQQGSHDAGGSR